MNNIIKLSPTTLNLYRNCPRCFWLEKIKNIKRPRGIFPSLPSGMDRAIKSFFDEYRKKQTLPPELSGSDFNGVSLFNDQKQLDLWRDWKTGLQYCDPEGIILFGAIDDLLKKGSLYIPFDYKTKGSSTSEDDAVKYYQMQLDCYALMIDANGLKPADYGFLLYFSPSKVSNLRVIEFEIQPIKVSIDPNRAKNILREASFCLKKSIPAASLNCEYCQWINNFRNKGGTI